MTEISKEMITSYPSMAVLSRNIQLNETVSGENAGIMPPDLGKLRLNLHT